MTWNEIYEAADGAACGDDTLKAKDEARHQVRCLAMELGVRNLVMRLPGGCGGRLLQYYENSV